MTPFPHASGIQPNPNVPVQVHETQVHAKVGQTLVINQLAPVEFWPKKFYPNKQISEGGMSHSIWVKDLPLTHMKSGCLMLISMRATTDIPS